MANIVGPPVHGNGHGRLLENALALGLGQGGLLAGLVAQRRLGQHLVGNVHCGVQQVLYPAIGPEHGAVARQPVALHKPAGGGGAGHIVALQGQLVRLARGQHLRKRRPQVALAVGLGHLGVVRKNIERAG